MTSIELPRALQDYFGFAETAPTRNGRRFSITLPYLHSDGKLDRLQWWYHLSPAEEKALGERAADRVRARAIARFELHIGRWLQNTAQILYGAGAIPQVRAIAAAPVELPATPVTLARPLEDAHPSDEVTVVSDSAAIAAVPETKAALGR